MGDVKKEEKKKDDVNPYTLDSPEWQLWENMTSYLRRANAHAADAERSRESEQKSMESYRKYRDALEKLTNE